MFLGPNNHRPMAVTPQVTLDSAASYAKPKPYHTIPYAESPAEYINSIFPNLSGAGVIHLDIAAGRS